MMDCRTFDLLLDKPEREWTEQERRDIEAHAAECADCAALLALRREMRAMDGDEPLPEGFTASWQNMIHTEAQKKMNGKISTFPWKRVAAAVAAVTVLAVGTAVSYRNGWGGSGTAKNAAQKRGEAGYSYTASNDYDVYDYAEPEEMELAAPMMAESASYSAKTAAAGDAYVDTDTTADTGASAQAAKIIRTVNFTIQTRNYESDYETIRRLVGEAGGRIESLSASGDGTARNLRRASFTLRVPSGRLDDFITGTKGVGTVTSFSENSEDVSERYYDTANRLNTQQVKMERLTELMKKAEDVSDLIELENAVSDTQYWIDYYTGSLRGYDSRVNDSYVYVNLREMSSADAAETPELSLGERILNAISSSAETALDILQASLIFLIAALPWIIAAVVVIVVIRLIIRRRKHHKKEKTQEE